ncbi:HNH endonuclease, partial [Butyricimonas virosa]
MGNKNNWTDEEHILAFNLYCKIPFSKINAHYPPVKELASILKRSNNAVAMKLANFARLDPSLKARNISGLTQGAKGEEVIWNKFNHNWEELAYQSECILAKYNGEPIGHELKDIPIDIIGREREAIVKLRINQNFFRKMILASYNTTCCITGSRTHELLTACHIIPWNIDKTNRMNPQNGLCMNILYHSA